MALTDVLFGQRRSTIGALTIDATIEEQHTMKLVFTQHPVERGYNITDHRRREPKTIKIVGVISNTPAKIAGFLGYEDRVVNTWQFFDQLMEDGELVDIVTSLAAYTNMMITQVDAPRNAQKGNVLEFTAYATELRVVDSQEVPAPEIERAADSPKPQAKAVGTKPPVPATAATQESSLFQMATKAKSLLGAPLRAAGVPIP